MIVEYKEPARANTDCEIRIGKSSWSHDSLSVKFTWFDKNGPVTRGGEAPVEALPQMLEVAIKKGGLKL